MYFIQGRNVITKENEATEKYPLTLFFFFIRANEEFSPVSDELLETVFPSLP